MAETVVYEVHVKGFSELWNKVPEKIRGTYAGMASPAAIDYFKRLGVTSVELLPVHQFIHDAFLVSRGLRNYWGYQSIGYFAPHGEYASSGDRGVVTTALVGLHVCALVGSGAVTPTRSTSERSAQA